MYILTNSKNVIVYISIEAVLKGDGIYVGSGVVFSDKTLKINNLDEIPNEIIPQKYCYNEELGFYSNNSYKSINLDPIDITEKVKYILEKIDPIVDMDKLTIDELKDFKILKVNTQCDTNIDNGTDVELSTGIEHFSLTIKDQKNIDKLMSKIQIGMENAPYHSDTNSCKIYSAIDIIKISIATDTFILYNTTYCNSLHTWIRRSDDREEIKRINFGSTLPEDLQLAFNEVMNTSAEELDRIKQNYGL